MCHMTFDEFELNTDRSLKYERIITAVFILMIVGFMLFDILDDWYEGMSLGHLIPEILIAVFGMGTVALLFLRFAKSRHVALNQARKEMIEAKKQAKEWRSQAGTFRQGLTDAINKQMQEWGMTEAEQDICFMLLKGFSLQEIADLRKTSERTVRQQASLIYKKSGLSGRVQLAAFFLEDLLVPQS